MKWFWPWQNPWVLYCLSGEHGEFIWKKSIPASTRAAVGANGLGIAPSNSSVRALDSDGERIVVGMDRVTAAGVGPHVANVVSDSKTRRLADFSKCYSVLCLNKDGRELWRADVGAVVWDVEIIPGVGVVVVHDNSHHIDDTLDISIPGAATAGGAFTVTDAALTISPSSSETGGFTAGIATTRTAADAMLVYRLRGLPTQYISLKPANPNPPTTALYDPADTNYSARFNRWDTNVEITGTTIVSGFQFKFNEQLGGPTGYRPVAFCQYPAGVGLESGSPAAHAIYQSTSLANVTLLNIESGAVIWRKNVFTSGALGINSNEWSPRCVCSDRAGNIHVLRPRVPNAGIAGGVTTLDYNGNITNQVSFSTPVNVIDGTDFIVSGGFVFARGSKYVLGTGAFVSAFPSQPYWYDHSTGLLWANGTPVDPTTGAQIPPVFNGGGGSRPLSNGYVAGPGGITPMGFYNSGLRKWRYLDTERDTNTGRISTLGAACGDRYVFAASRVVNDPNSTAYTESWEDFDGYYGT